MLKIGLPNDLLVFNMGILIPGKMVFMLRRVPSSQVHVNKAQFARTPFDQSKATYVPGIHVANDFSLKM